VPERKIGSFVKIKSKIPDFEREKANILTTGIRVVFRGLKFESDPREIGLAFHRAGADIGDKDSFRSGTIHA
jgi:hypothetical protein